MVKHKDVQNGTQSHYFILGNNTLGLLFSVLTIFRFYAFRTRAWDLGIFTQSFWTTAYAGKFLYHTCELFINPSGVFFGVHFSPILFFVLPFYWAIPRPETLLVLQSFAIGSAAIPIYKLAKEYTGGRIVGLVFCGSLSGLSCNTICQHV